jgi:cobalt/nickel transport system permease protein
MNTPEKHQIKTRRLNAVEHALSDISQALERSLFAEEMSGREGLLQSLDPRAKLVGVLALLLAVALSHSLWVIVAVYLLAIALAWRSAIPANFFIRRVWLFLPFFTGVIALPALFLTPGPVLVELPFGLEITRTGLVTAMFLLLRVSTSASLGLLLVLTTPWNAILSALGVMRVPDMFILILGMTYRYIYLLLRLANELFLSRKSRVVGRLRRSDQRRIIADSSAALLNRSLALSGEVYLAMQSRGYRGKAVTYQPFQLHRRDWAWGGLLVAASLAAILLGR